MEYRMKDIMEPPKTLEEQKKEAREAAMAAGAEVLGEEWKPGTLENVKRQVENAYTWQIFGHRLRLRRQSLLYLITVSLRRRVFLIRRYLTRQWSEKQRQPVPVRSSTGCG